ncbi:MAG: 5-formyltetrahydrofolate cyclo-ligase [Luteolibacter sp.]
MDHEPTSTRKAVLRRGIVEVLRGVPTPLPDVASQVALWLRGHPEIRRITLFFPLSGEPDLMRLVAWFPERTWCFPRVIDAHALAFHPVLDPDKELQPSAFGIREPREGAVGIPIREIDAFICPGLAFDRSGGRLGRGCGYYDRMLAGAREDAVRIGASFACQIVDSTHSESHDVRMDVVICESGII